MHTKKCSRGFSLLELMMVVAIIGFLASMAVPRFQKYSARARQSGAKSEMAGIYVAEVAFKTEYGVYHAYLPAVGFEPMGIDPLYVTGQVLPTANRYYASVIEHSIGPVGSVDRPVPLQDLGLTDPERYRAGGIPSWKAWGASKNLCPVMEFSTTVGMRWFLYNSANPAACPTTASGGFCLLLMGCPSKKVSPGDPMVSSFEVDLDVWRMREDRSMVQIQSGV